MKPIVTIDVDWSQYQPGGNHPAQALLDKIKNKIDQLSTTGEIDKSMAEINSCTYQYWGCGSCSGDQARVDAYCSSSGGSQPDYSWCEQC